jgi:hypothetical protein
MLSPLNDQTGSQSLKSAYQSVLSQFQGEIAERLNIEQMFILIDGVLPFEACLYYQVLPLFIEGSRLHLGMVSLEDTSASDYVRRIVSYHNYSIVSRQISSEALRNTLSTYLNYSGKRQSAQENQLSRSRLERSVRPKSDQKVDQNVQETLVVDSPEELNGEGFLSADARTNFPHTLSTASPSKSKAGSATTKNSPNPSKTTSADKASQASPAKTQPTPNVEVPKVSPLSNKSEVASASTPISEVETKNVENTQASKVVTDSEFIGESAIASESERVDQAELIGEPPLEEVVASPPLAQSPVQQKPGLTRASQADIVPPSAVPSVKHPANLSLNLKYAIAKQRTSTSTPAPLINPLIPLEVQIKHLNSPADVLATLSPKELLQELLGRVLFGGIGRLYFERQINFGRVLWSQNGVLQSIVDHLDLATFQGVINELKLMTGLPLISVAQAKQVEIERLYQQTRLLLRFRFMPNERGEEATLQVLRGAALKFYQQQQLANLERDALTIAKQLQNKISEIRDRALTEPGLSSMKLEILPSLSQLLHSIEEQLGALQQGEDQEVSE